MYVLGIEDLCTKRDELQKQILNEEEEKAKIQNDIRILSERLAKINESLAKKIASRTEYDKTIAETEAAYMKVSFNFQENNLFWLICSEKHSATQGVSLKLRMANLVLKPLLHHWRFGGRGDGVVRNF